MKYNLVATTPMGLESIVAKEVQELGYETKVENGRVYYSGDKRAIVKSNLWLRCADRVKIVVAKFPAYTFEELFEKTKAIDWAKYLPEDAKFPVDGRSHKSKLFSVSDCQSIVKKAIVEKMKKSYGISGWLQETGARFRLEIIMLNDEATILLDTSGDGLHKRGYRANQGIAPIKETLAAAMVKLTNWKGDIPFYDLFCGSGTLLIEAAMMAQNMAPGINRKFDFEKWYWMPKALVEEERNFAEEAIDYEKELELYGSDLDPKMIETAQNNVDEIGLGSLIELKQMTVYDFVAKKETACIIANPPYGERIGEKAEVEKMYRFLGQALKDKPYWSLYLLTSHKLFENLYGKKATKRRKLFNGSIECTYYQYWGERLRNNN
ncbi:MULTISPECIES: class I SAM-dependent RNA methyltransferase [unclassified Gemella]|uniref:THUMP domain-containing class I SAM-dependent RNA methyltransferase n=1 Tax=unclassified Gemella TaxID=2624949 RepID=UPI00107415C7|nr:MULTISPECIES: class I SAM-dependent RNA methyltransferase [unclassified Gemella]MBF0710241.1 class I SAM-dependent RNA methyltransferase [Gemella sp. GL1.1]MBF0746331.1 class I SAM-dependent RNA methyltransferase [Gemella sp. 19428wG2_WT2a]NYS27585.1 class I SAM-dependent RNA methyltransferase [Gemella sp. GL1]TFU60607.1 class I SAM-dependent RNA methyltransferase [Gemella sp. WT2a]